MRKKKNIIILLIIIVLALIITGVIIYLATDLFKSPSKLFWKYFVKAGENIEILSDDKIAMQNEFRRSGSYISNGQLSFKLEQGENSFKELNIVTTSRRDANTGRTYADAILKNGDLDIFKVSYINSGDVYGIKCDEVAPVYVGARNTGLQKLAKDYKIPNGELIPDSIYIDSFYSDIKLNNEQKKYVKDTYIPIIMNNIQNEQYAKGGEQILVNDTEYHNVNTYSLKLSGENAKKIFIECLDNLKADNESLVMLSTVFSKLGFNEEFANNENLNIEIQKLIEKIQESECEGNWEIYLYEESGNVIRAELRLQEKAIIMYDKLENRQKLLIEVSGKDADTIIYNNDITENSNDIIDLGGYIDREEESKTLITISKEKQENSNNSIVEIVPDTQREEKKVTIEVNRSNIQNNSYSNVYNIVINVDENNVINILHNSNTVRVNQVEEIMELTDSNTAIANNYNEKQFKSFITGWYEILKNKFITKLETLGFEN